jgi:hypothetical protein
MSQEVQSFSVIPLQVKQELWQLSKILIKKIKKNYLYIITSANAIGYNVARGTMY